eukprot:CAMPEP_0174281182 /NCGR_PEP_ID=MMETSP0809-20121228/1535_1 /TAXON_ID=73025 ORGANISM="Eutreptiella gymnastica-like, Strain CCMP1594" /NCGR_SAMPLE_ID=MMETSP0809 /ASSEMBLY_ACC=CAM_ASM_000658 /LENGTH=52 /DNA_ID=CAMNT_0015374553 /DNA_START=513 /DNA_END=667 /DNA_ORIENTATION=-
MPMPASAPQKALLIYIWGVTTPGILFGMGLSGVKLIVSDASEYTWSAAAVAG